MTNTRLVAAPETPLAHQAELSNRIDAIGWGVLLIMTGAIWLLPISRSPRERG